MQAHFLFTTLDSNLCPRIPIEGLGALCNAQRGEMTTPPLPPYMN